MDTPLFNINDGQEVIGVRSINTPVVQESPQTKVIDLLKRALLEEIIAWFQYNSVRNVISGPERPSIEGFFKEAEMDELYDHAEKIKQRLTELGDNLQFLQTTDMKALFERTPNQLVPLTELSTQAAVILNLNAERAAVNTYNELISAARDAGDSVTCLMAKNILTDEEEHLRALKDFADDLKLEY
jgi:bacterioferritin